MCPMIEPNFTEAVDRLPAGEYQARIVGSEVKRSKEKNHAYARWECEVFGNADERFNGRKFWYTTMAEGPGAGMLRKLLKVLGVENLTDTDQLHGREFTAVIVYKDDSEFPDVKSIKAIKNSEAA